MDRLVWCEESSSRAGTRCFYRVDLSDNNKKKACSNASIAMKCMQEFTNTDFYDDMRKTVQSKADGLTG